MPDLTETATADSPVEPIARAERLGQRARSRHLFHIVVFLGLLQSVLTATVVIIALRTLNFGLQPQLASALALVLCALPGVALYRISTSVSRGMKVMQHDIYSRGLTEPIMTTLGLLAAVALGSRTFAPEIAAIIGTGASGLIALKLAANLFRSGPRDRDSHSASSEARQLISYAAPISTYQLINALISRLDVI